MICFDSSGGLVYDIIQAGNEEFRKQSENTNETFDIS